jgi:hypothetical protein
MMFIPGIFITILTFPGFIMETVARRFWCDILRIPVYEVHYFKGTIIHEKINGPLLAVILALAPLTLNTILCAVLCFPTAFTWLLGSDMEGLQVFLAWVGLSIGMHALPSRGIIQDYLKDIPDDSRYGWSYYFARIIEVIFTVIDFLKRLWIDVAYAIVVGIAAPYLITWISMLF